MRLLAAVLFVALTGSVAVAEEAKPADPKPDVAKKKVPYRVVKILPETGQVLLFERIHATHVVAEVGQVLAGYTVDAIDEDEVTLIADTGAEIILTAPPPPPRQAEPRDRRAKAAPAPIDPYAEPAEPGETAPVDPYADPEAPKTPGEGGVRVASASPATATATPAPAAPTAAPIIDTAPYGDPGIAAFADAVGATPATPAPATPPAKPAANDAASALAAAATGTPVPATAAAATPGLAMIARGELDAALADFSKLAGSFKATFTPGGLRLDAVSDGSLLAKAGLQKGDVVTSVDERPLRSLDDAATLYARAATVRSTTIAVVRAGKPVTLKVAFQ